jgi:hypothetical protein
MSVTIVSIVPFAIDERKPLTPAFYTIPAASYENPQCLLVEDATSFVYVGEGRGRIGEDRTILPLPVSALAVARSVIVDFSGSQIAVILGEAEPGLFIVEGEVLQSAIRPRLQPELDLAQTHQLNWFKQLVSIADDDWKRYGQHRMISDIQRYAGRDLKMDRPWLLEAEFLAQLSECPSCYEKVNPKAIVCAHCRFILDVERHSKMTYTTA